MGDADNRRFAIGRQQVGLPSGRDSGFGVVLLAFAQKYGKRASNGDVVIPIRLTQGDIADLVGASRKRVNQVMVTYKRRGLLAVDDASRITIHDAAGLATYCA